MVYNLNLTLFSTLLLYQKRHTKITLEFPHQLKLQVFHVKFWFLSCCVFRYQKDKDYHNLLATTSFLYSLKTFKFNELIQKSTCSLLLLLISQLLRINKLHFKVAHFKVVYLKPEKNQHIIQIVSVLLSKTFSFFDRQSETCNTFQIAL